MGKVAKMMNCKACGQEMGANAKVCPACGAKNQKPVYKKWWFWLIIIIVLAGIGGANENTDNNVNNSDSSQVNNVADNTKDSSPENIMEESNMEESNMEESNMEESNPGIELSTNLEKAIYSIVEDNDGELFSVDTNKDTGLVAVAVLCQNDEKVVKAIMTAISYTIQNTSEEDSVIVTFGDIKDGKDGNVLVVGAVESDGTITYSMESDSYKTERRSWINSQFSAWDGSHSELTKMIKRNLNDEKSYKHINTTYIDVNTESVRDDVNKILKNAGYSARVEIGDLFITTEFSAKNAFGGVVKNTAFGIASYKNNTINLIDIG